jgi:D-aspartate ligase
MKALIIHTRRTGLGLIRSLGKKRVKVYSADEYKSPGFYSRYVTKGYLIPNIISEGEDVFVKKMMQIGSEIGSSEKVFLFTSSDNYLIIISKYWHLLSKYFISVSETNEEKLLDNLYKDRMYKIAESANVNHPRTQYSNNINYENLSFPVVIKPSIRKTSNSDVGESVFKIKKCKDKSELVDAISLLEKNNSSFVVQDFIPGDDDQLFTVGLYALKGEVIAAASARKIRQFPPLVGECSFGELVNEPLAIEEANKYIKKSGISGICQLEFKRYHGKHFLMEINPRPWSWNSIIDYAGINLPYIACKTILNPTSKILYRQKKYKGTWVFSLMDFKYHVLLNKNISIVRFFYNVFFSSKHAYLDFKDPLPLISALLQFLKKPIQSFGGKSN